MFFQSMLECIYLECYFLNLFYVGSHVQRGFSWKKDSCIRAYIGIPGKHLILSKGQPTVVKQVDLIFKTNENLMY